MKIEAEKIAALNHVETKSILDMSMLEILTGVKDTWIEIIIDCVNFKFNYKNLLYDGKLFYIGVSIVIIFMTKMKTKVEKKRKFTQIKTIN